MEEAASSAWKADYVAAPGRLELHSIHRTRRDGGQRFA
jgi:hypothetical protein